jgi:hypothetical protein
MTNNDSSYNKTSQFYGVFAVFASFAVISVTLSMGLAKQSLYGSTPSNHGVCRTQECGCASLKSK